MLKTRMIDTAAHLAGETYNVDNEEIAFEWLSDGSAQDADDAPIEVAAPALPPGPVDEAAERGRLAALAEAEQPTPAPATPDPTTNVAAQPAQEE